MVQGVTRRRRVAYGGSVSLTALLLAGIGACGSSARELEASAGSDSGGSPDTVAEAGSAGRSVKPTPISSGGRGADAGAPSHDSDAGMGPSDGGSAGDGATNECQVDTDCRGKLPETTPVGCAQSSCKDGSCVLVARDADGDGEPSARCEANDQTNIVLGADCDDGDPSVNSKAKETCDGKDNDCNGAVDDDVPASTITCQVGVGACVASGTLSCKSGSYSKCDAAPQQPSADSECDGIDHDCDGKVDNTGCVCKPGAAVSQSRTCGEPAKGTCTADGKLPPFDPGPGKSTFCLDNDGDGYPSGSCSDYCVGSQPAKFIRSGGARDCDDNNGAAHPGGTEVCDSVDNNCDGQVDEVGKDCQGQHLACGAVCPNGYSPDPNDGGACISNTEHQVFQLDPTIGWGNTNGYPGGCGVKADQTVAVSCGSNAVQSSYSVMNISGSGHCEGVWANNADISDCSVRIHYGTSWCDSFTCDISIMSRNKTPRCQ